MTALLFCTSHEDDDVAGGVYVQVYICFPGWEDPSGAGHPDVPSTHLPTVAGARSRHYHPGQTKQVRNKKCVVMCLF